MIGDNIKISLLILSLVLIFISIFVVEARIFTCVMGEIFLLAALILMIYGRRVSRDGMVILSILMLSHMFSGFSNIFSKGNICIIQACPVESIVDPYYMVLVMLGEVAFIIGVFLTIYRYGFPRMLGVFFALSFILFISSYNATTLYMGVLIGGLAGLLNGVGALSLIFNASLSSRKLYSILFSSIPVFVGYMGGCLNVLDMTISMVLIEIGGMALSISLFYIAMPQISLMFGRKTGEVDGKSIGEMWSYLSEKYLSIYGVYGKFKLMKDIEARVRIGMSREQAIREIYSRMV